MVISTSATSLAIYLLVVSSGGYMAGPIAAMLATAVAPVAAMATFVWHALGSVTVGPGEARILSPRQGGLAKAFVWLVVGSVLIAVLLEFFESSWGALSFTVLFVSGATYLLAYRFLV